jgi:hypothetical protein
MLIASSNVRQGQSGKHMHGLSSSQFDPNRTSVRKRNLVPRQRKKRTDSPPERLEGTIDPKLLDTPVCPISKGALQFGWTRQELTSRAARLAYPSATAAR